jgi:dihydroflavonol-4-reductase
VERFIFTSSLSAMGIPEKNELLTEAHEFNLSPEMFPYGAAKYAAEKIVREKVAQGLDAVILNPSLVLGPGDLNQITGSMVVEAARGWGFFYVSGGANYVHISDVARGHVAAALHGEKGQRYILGGENISHKDAFTTLTEIVGRRPPWLHIPDWLVRVGARALKLLPRFPFLPFDANQLRLSQNHIYCAIHPARQALGLGEPLSFRQAAQDAYEWYLQAGIIKPTT